MNKVVLVVVSHWADSETRNFFTDCAKKQRFVDENAFHPAFSLNGFLQIWLTNLTIDWFTFIKSKFKQSVKSK